MIEFINSCIKKLKTGKKGFEPLTPWFVATCSSPLSYKPFCSINKVMIYPKLSGAVGFEPTNGGVKVRCLTTWRRPIFSMLETSYVDDILFY